MDNKKNKILGLFLCLFLVTACSNTLQSVKEGQTFSKSEAMVFFESFKLIQTQYVDEVTAQDLVQGAINGMIEVVNQKGETLSPEVLEAIGNTKQEAADNSLEAFRIIQRQKTDKVKAQELIHGAIKGMVSVLDSHSSYITPEATKEMQKVVYGVGLQLGIKENSLVVIEPTEGTPADKAGIKAGDFIVKVNEEITKDMTLTDAVQRIRGPKGSEITLTIRREGEQAPLVFSLVREVIKIESVKSKILEDGIGYVRISQFQESTAKDLSKALKKLKDEKRRALILDLRNNSGGLLTSAVEVAEQFIDKGRRVVYIKGREEKKDEYFADNKAEHEEYPMIVLVNNWTASGSEIVASALQDWKRAIILGNSTFGRASIQTILPLSDGSILKLTTARFLTPNGNSIQGKGITPDIVIEQSRTAAGQKGFRDLESDVQLQQAIEVLKSKQKWR